MGANAARCCVHRITPLPPPPPPSRPSSLCVRPYDQRRNDRHANRHGPTTNRPTDRPTDQPADTQQQRDTAPAAARLFDRR
ncbi:unnamed protein product [Soboliphyme baturini]|uniref:Uncharacterized protein n=1 Tax=Soboliphyme baturini TaxID=241478 RepID=A0A183IB23_9BILA|nr:unnamed protein product [Soboliphyme baturini]